VKLTWEKIEVFLVVFLGGATFNLVGTISIAEIYLLIISPRLYRYVKYSSFPEKKNIISLYVIYFIVQMLSECLNGNLITNSFRGFAVTIFSFLSFIYIFSMLNKNVKLIIVVLLGLVFRNVFFPNSLAEDSEMSFFKFYLVPIISNLVLVISYYMINNKRKNLAIYVVVAVGVFFMLMDSRSAGLTLVLVGFIVRFGPQLKKRIVLLPIFIVLIYGLYCVYVIKVLNHEFGGEHSYNQLARIENPFNPFTLLMTGRAETFVAIEAISDEFLLGHGTWAKDVTGKYHIMVLTLQNSDTEGAIQRVFDEGIYSVIPAHSVILGAGVYNGILALLIVLLIVILFIKIGFQAINFNSPYIVILVRMIIGIIWTSLFSPINSFKGSLPIFFAIVLVLYINRNKNLFDIGKRHIGIQKNRVQTTINLN